MTYFKVVTPELRDFHTGTKQYRIGGTFRSGTPAQGRYRVQTRHVLHASLTAPQAARWGRWPYRLLTVDGSPVAGPTDDGKVGFRQLTVTDEMDVAACFGPNGTAVLDLIHELEGFTAEQWSAAGDAAWSAAGDAAWYAARSAAGDAIRWHGQAPAWSAARSAARYAAWSAARYAARSAARSAAWYAAWYAARSAAEALVVADLVGQHGHIDTLMAPIEAARNTP